MADVATPRRNTSVLRKHMGFVAYPTIVLLVGALTLWGLNVYAFLSGIIPLWLGAIFTVLCGYISFTPFHEATHGNISGKTHNHWLDTICGWLAGLPFWAPYTAFVLVHLTHHANTNDPEKDPDYWVFSSNPLGVFLRTLMVYPNYAVHIFYKIPKRRRRVLRTQIEMLIYLSMLGVGICQLEIYFAGVGEALLLAWILPGFLTHCSLSWTLDYLPHWPHKERARYGQTRVLEGKGLGILLLGQNLHVVHHLYPHVPFYRYRPVFEAIKPKLESEDIRFEPILLSKEQRQTLLAD
ncbi:MAG: fatty acid desaturase [Myxococcota bacterium]|nr:fatty acid desaturase [Myxococcota bacterium]